MKKLELPEDVEFILDRLEFHKFKAYVCGGSVRDSLLNIKPKDWDITTSAKPEQILKIFREHKTIETGIKHGTVTVVINNANYEITTFRTDGVYSDNRHPDSVEFVDNVIDDLARRDFTINAMAYNHKEGLIDPFEGEVCLKEKIIKCVGDPNDRFQEDALRMLRAIRFASQLGFIIWHETANAITDNASLITNISKERISSELIKILSGKFPAFYINTLRDLYLLKYIIPELDVCFEIKQNNPWHIYNVGTHILVSLVDSPEDINIRLALMLHDIGKPLVKTTDGDGIDHFVKHEIESARIAEEWLKEYKFDNNTVNEVVTLVKWHDFLIDPSKKAVKKLMNSIGKDLTLKLLDVRIQDIKAQNEDFISSRTDKINGIRALIEEISLKNEAFSLKDLAINGDDLIKEGFLPNRELGDFLNRLLEHVIENPEDNKKDILLQMAKNYKDFLKSTLDGFKTETGEYVHDKGS